LVCAKHQTQKLWITDVTGFGKSVDQLEGSFSVVFQNEPSAFTGLGYAHPMMLLGDAMSAEQHRNFPEVCKPRTVLCQGAKDLFASPTSGKICNLIHIVQG